MRWAGPLFLLSSVALWAFIGQLAWQLAVNVVLGCMFTAQAYPHLFTRTDRWDTYVDREKVGWATPLRRRTVPLASISDVTADTETPRWATKVVLVLEDDTRHQIPTTSPVELIEVLEIRRAEACGRRT